MKVLILTVSAGEGHNAMSKALELCLQGRCETRIYDLFKGNHKVRSKTVNDGYFWLCKTNIKLANKFYEGLKKRKPERRKNTLVHSLIRPAKKKVEQLIEEYQPDVVFTAHTYAAVMMSDMKRKGKIHMPVVSIVSDYDLSPYIECSIYIDYIVSPSDYFDGQLHVKGFRQEQIRHLGIPVQRKFSEKIDRAEARAALGIAPDKFTIMIMNGGVGFGNNLALVQNVVQAKHAFQLVIVNGRNVKMKEAIDEFIAENSIDYIKNIGFANNVDVIMSASDLLIGKIGGVAIAEAFNKGLPILAANKQPWQEYDNMLFLRERGACEYIEDSGRVHEIIDDLIAHPEKLDAMRRSMSEIAMPDASVNIADFLVELGNAHCAGQ